MIFILTSEVSTEDKRRDTKKLPERKTCCMASLISLCHSQRRTKVGSQTKQGWKDKKQHQKADKKGKHPQKAKAPERFFLFGTQAICSWFLVPPVTHFRIVVSRPRLPHDIECSRFAAQARRFSLKNWVVLEDFLGAKKDALRWKEPGRTEQTRDNYKKM
jgi:hypothetical protein